MARICKVQKGSMRKPVLPDFAAPNLLSRYQNSTAKVLASTKVLTTSSQASSSGLQVFGLTLRTDLVHLITSIPQAEQLVGSCFSFVSDHFCTTFCRDRSLLEGH